MVREDLREKLGCPPCDGEHPNRPGCKKRMKRVSPTTESTRVSNMTANKTKTKPIAADVKKVIAALAKHAPIDALLDEFRVKYDDQAFALLRW